jgi:Asp-tRNA(Asn)/Glu-tRNA(Gln) amidotransferase A subunit family amidase
MKNPISGSRVMPKTIFSIVLTVMVFGSSFSENITKADDIYSASNIIGMEFTASEIDSMLKDLADNLEAYLAIREIGIANSIRPALIFEPMPFYDDKVACEELFRVSAADIRGLPEDIEELAFWSVRDLAELIRSGKISSLQLTGMYLERLKKYGQQLECIITVTEELALEQARRADEEIAAGNYRGMLHGIPYGAKDLLSTRGTRTTWGARPYKDQIIDEDATVIKKLQDAGAVLVAKLTLGALAWGDVWYGGMTRNPWDLEQGSSGSSAGSASATAAGLVAFSIGTETWGSIVSPCTRCGVTGLRPTFGRVSRAGAMALSWSMDKIGPICRTVEDCAVVFNAIRGPDGKDPTVVDHPFCYDSGTDLGSLRIGYLKNEFEKEYDYSVTDSVALDVLSAMGFTLIPIELPALPIYPLAVILSAEAAAAFDELTRSGRDDMMVKQVREAWPNVLRASRFIPAVEYIQANRIRYMISRKMEELDVDIYIAPSFGENLLLTNLTGHPCVVLPNGFDDEGHPVSISFIGRLFGEGVLLAFARAYQEETGFHGNHPPMFKIGD